jgi:hypothetical protein
MEEQKWLCHSFNKLYLMAQTQNCGVKEHDAKDKSVTRTVGLAL